MKPFGIRRLRTNMHKSPAGLEVLSRILLYWMHISRHLNKGFRISTITTQYLYLFLCIYRQYVLLCHEKKLRLLLCGSDKRYFKIVELRTICVTKLKTKMEREICRGCNSLHKILLGFLSQCSLESPRLSQWNVYGLSIIKQYLLLTYNE